MLSSSEGVNSRRICCLIATPPYMMALTLNVIPQRVDRIRDLTNSTMTTGVVAVQYMLQI